MRKGMGLSNVHMDIIFPSLQDVDPNAQLDASDIEFALRDQRARADGLKELADAFESMDADVDPSQIALNAGMPRVPRDARRLVRAMIHPDPTKRPSFDDILRHDWLNPAGAVSPYEKRLDDPGDRPAVGAASVAQAVRLAYGSAASIIGARADRLHQMPAVHVLACKLLRAYLALHPKHDTTEAVDNMSRGCHIVADQFLSCDPAESELFVPAHRRLDNLQTRARKVLRDLAFVVGQKTSHNHLAADQTITAGQFTLAERFLMLLEASPAAWRHEDEKLADMAASMSRAVDTAAFADVAKLAWHTGADDDWLRTRLEVAPNVMKRVFRPTRNVHTVAAVDAVAAWSKTRRA